MALKYAELGASVCVASRKQNILDEAAQMIREKTNADVLAIATDVRSPQDVAKMLGALNLRCGVSSRRELQGLTAISWIWRLRRVV